ncbi:MAG: hypothetical protein FJW20_17385 [Acidimicrobiia bacterium]|nr:hypothetical protein [Acidimicrobiia bacterium]
MYLHRHVRRRQARDPRDRCRIWREAYRDFQNAGIRLQTTDVNGEIQRSPGGRPVFLGLKRGVINMVITDNVPMHWDQARGLSGISTIHEGYHLSMISMKRAHTHRVPFFSVNTCVHELLHVIFQDIYLPRQSTFKAGQLEARVDWQATRMWLFPGGDEIRKAAEAYLERASRLQ